MAEAGWFYLQRGTLARMRGLCAAALVVFASVAWADRLIGIPTGSKVPLGDARIGFLQQLGDRERWSAYCGFGITKALDGEVTAERGGRGSTVASCNVAYNLVAPLINYTPGISIGVVDILDRTEDGRGLYVAVTYRLSAEETQLFSAPVELTLGVGAGAFHGAFVGLALPFSNELRGVFEHDSRRISAGFEWRPLSGLAIRYGVRDDQGFASATVSLRF